VIGIRRERMSWVMVDVVVLGFILGTVWAIKTKSREVIDVSNIIANRHQD